MPRAVWAAGVLVVVCVHLFLLKVINIWKWELRKEVLNRFLLNLKDDVTNKPLHKGLISAEACKQERQLFSKCISTCPTMKMRFQLMFKPVEYKIIKKKSCPSQLRITYLHFSIIYKRCFPKGSVRSVYTNKPQFWLPSTIYIISVHGSFRSSETLQSKKEQRDHLSVRADGFQQSAPHFSPPWQQECIYL